MTSLRTIDCWDNSLARYSKIFTKLLRYPLAYLRSQGYQSVIYIDDTYLQGDTYLSCYNNILATIALFEDLGFTVNMAKSVLVPTQSIEFLGFLLNSNSMTISLTEKRKQKVFSQCTTLLLKDAHSIRVVASVIGSLIAALPANRYGGLFYRGLERDKNVALSRNHGNFNKLMTHFFC